MEETPVSEPEIITENLKEEAIKKVTDFVSTVFNGQVPQQIQDRLVLLPSKLIISDEETEAELAKDQQRSNNANKYIEAFYRPAKDQIFARSSSQISTLIHEMLHFLSTHHNEGGSGIRTAIDPVEYFNSLENPEKFDSKSNKPNEAMTEILSLMITEGINPSDPLAIYQITGRFNQLQDKGEVISAPSYQDYVTIFLNFIRQSTQHRGIFSALARHYFLNDSQGFNKEINHRASPLAKALDRLTGTSAAERLRKATGKEGENEWESIKTAAIAMREHFISDARFTAEQKTTLALFCKALDQPKQYELRYVYPTSDPHYSRYPEKIQIREGTIDRETPDITETPTIIDVSLDLIDLLVPLTEDTQSEEPVELDPPFIYTCQLEAYLLWQGIKLKYLEDNHIKYDYDKKTSVNKYGDPISILRDSDIYGNPVMQDYLSRLSVSELAMVLKTFVMVLKQNPLLSKTEMAEIMNKRNTQNPQDESHFWFLDEAKKEDALRIPELLNENHLPENLLIPYGNWVLIPKVDKTDLETIY